MSKFLRKAVVCLFALPALVVGTPAPVEAEIIGTLTAIEATQRDRNLEKVSAALAGDEVRSRLAGLGVQPADVEARVAALTDDELRTLAERLDSMPAGAGVIELLGIIFIVLLVLELVGVIDIFKKNP